jgi:hypothetical protein
MIDDRFQEAHEDVQNFHRWPPQWRHGPPFEEVHFATQLRQAIHVAARAW